MGDAFRRKVGGTTMKMSDLEECVSLSKTLSFTQTASEFYITQSALTKHIANLENELKVRLFTRGSKGVTLTEAGKAFVDGAEDVLSAYGQMLDRVSQVVDGRQSVIRVGFQYGAAYQFLASAKSDFLKGRKDVAVQLIAYEQNEIVGAVQSEEVHMGIASILELESLNSGIFEWRELYEDRLCVIAPAASSLARTQDGISFSELKGVSLLRTSTAVFEPGDSSRLAQLIRETEVICGAREEVTDLMSLKMLMSTGSYACIVPAHTAPFFGSKYKALPLDDKRIAPGAVCAIWKRGEAFEGLKRFADCVEAKVAARR